MDLSLESLIVLIVLLPLLGAILNGFLGHRLPRWLIGFVGNGTVLASFVLSAVVAHELAGLASGAKLSVTLYRWMQAGDVAVDVALTVDRLSAVMILVITGVGSVIHLYSRGYMAHDPAYGRYFSYLNLFMFAMLVLVLGDSMPVVFVGWEGVGLCSYLLIGFWFTDSAKASAGKKAFIVNRIGDFGFIVAMAVLLRVTGTLSFEGLRVATLGGMVTPLVATSAALLLVLGATGKSAQIPLYVWLPDAMAGPTPVSALIHAATMVTAGVYLTARMGFLFAMSPVAMVTLACIGATTAVFAASIGTQQHDIKKVLAYSTVSQLGFMFMAAGVGAYAVALFHLVTHAFFKACLFLGAGSVIHGMSGEQDVRHMGGLWKKMPITAVTFIVATLAITGLPFMSGFISKDAILWSVFVSDRGQHAAAFVGVAKLLWILGAFAASLTAFYMWRLVFLTFFAGGLRANPSTAASVRESPWSMTLPLVILAVGSAIGGAVAWPEILGGGNWLEQWLRPVLGAAPLPEGHSSPTLEWALMGVSTTVSLAGALLAYWLHGRGKPSCVSSFFAKEPWRWLQARVSGRWYLDELYDTVIVRPLTWSARVLLTRGLERAIDGTVHFVGYVVRTIGVLGQLVQTGNIQKYIAIFVIGVALLLYGWLLPASSSTASRGTPPVVAGERTAPPALNAHQLGAR